MIEQLRIVKIKINKETVVTCFKIPAQHVPRGDEENHEKPPSV
jgi:hypothetical protein